MMGPPRIDNITERTAALVASLTQTMSTRVVVSGWEKHYDAYKPAQLAKGVVQVFSLGEGDYKKARGVVAREGVQTLGLICYLKLDEKDTPAKLQAAEFALMEEIKSWSRTSIPGIGLRLDSLEQSRQLEHPYGWVLAYIQAGPPDETT